MTYTNQPDTCASQTPVIESKVTLVNGILNCEWRLFNVPITKLNWLMEIRRDPSRLNARLFNK